jgi:hypothetical protein
MAYHGEDLDLRTPQTWTLAPADIIPPDESVSNGKRGHLLSGPVLVDETVLGSFNQAYDIAAAHRAGEVRIEHLLNAMTRLDAAAVALESHGIRVLALKRETASIIAGDIPAVAGSGPVSPRRSDELAEILKLAVAYASRRNAAVTVDDLLHILFEQRGDLSAADLLSRYAPRMSEPLPPLTRQEPRYTPLRTRYTSDYGRSSYRGDYLGSATDVAQNSRIEALEQAIRALGQDLAGERHAIADLLRDWNRDTMAYQDDQGRSHAVLIDRIGAMEYALREGAGNGQAEPSLLMPRLENIEAGIGQRLDEMSHSWSVLSNRLQDLEAAVRNQPLAVSGGAGVDDIRQAIDLKPISDRLEIIEEAVLNGGGDKGITEVGDRLGRLEDGVGQLLATPASSGTGTSDTFADGLERIDNLSGLIDSHHGSFASLLTNLADRLEAAERAIAAEIETAAAKHQAYSQDLTEVHEALLKVNQNQHTLAGSMDQWRTEAASDVATIMNRLAVIDRDNALPAETLSALNTHMDAMNKFIIERYHRRHRFLYWLFGTDDWLGASWPASRAKAEDDSHRLKVVGETEG